MSAPFYLLHLAKPAAPGTHRSAIGLLLLVVLLVHVLLLQTQPAAWALTQNTDTPQTAAFNTRSIAPVPEAKPLPAVPAVKRPVPQPAVKAAPAIAAPISAENTTPAQSETVPSAIDSVAHASASGAEDSQISATPAVASPKSEPAPSASLAAAPVKLAPSARLTYQVTAMSRGLPYNTSSELAWQVTANSYNAHLSSSMLFWSGYSASVGQIGPAGLAPTRYAEKSKTELAAHFVPDKQQIIFSANTPTVPWLEGVQDRLSVLFQLGGLLAANPQAFVEGSSVSFYTVGPRSADTWTFVVEPAERLQLPRSEVQTLKLTRQPGRDYDKKVELWFAPELHYLPVRQRVTQQNGDFIDQQLKDWRLL